MNKILNRNQLKYLAIIAMVIDHIGFFFVDKDSIMYTICRIIGKITAPTMCYFLIEGYLHTSSKFKYGIRLLIFAVISQFSFSLAIYNTLFIFELNMIFTLFICFLILLSCDKIKNKFVKLLSIICLIWITQFCDWGIFAPLWTIVFYKSRNNLTIMLSLYYVVSSAVLIARYISYYLSGYIMNNLMNYLGLLLFLPMIYLYNGEKGKSNKFNRWFFYIFYPLQFLIFFLLKQIV